MKLSEDEVRKGLFSSFFQSILENRIVFRRNIHSVTFTVRHTINVCMNFSSKEQKINSKYDEIGDHTMSLKGKKMQIIHIKLQMF